jgi:hypothetical protein
VRNLSAENFIRHRREVKGDVECLDVVLHLGNGKPYSAITARIQRGDLPGVDLVIHRSVSRPWHNHHKECPVLGGECWSDTRTPENFPTDETQQIKALVDELRALHPTMVSSRPEY